MQSATVVTTQSAKVVAAHDMDNVTHYENIALCTSIFLVLKLTLKGYSCHFDCVIELPDKAFCLMTLHYTLLDCFHSLRIHYHLSKCALFSRRTKNINNILRKLRFVLYLHYNGFGFIIHSTVQVCLGFFFFF